LRRAGKEDSGRRPEFCLGDHGLRASSGSDTASRASARIIFISDSY
jgi:hypothetical protein